MARAHPYETPLRRMQRYGLIVGVLGIAGCVVGWIARATPFFQGYLVALVFWVGISLGCMCLLMIHHLSAKGWGFVTQRFLEAGALTLPLMALLFIPLFFGLDELYRWANAEIVAESALLQHKAAYLNAPFFIARTVFYFVAWGLIAYFLRRWSLRLDATDDARFAKRLRRLSAGGLVFYFYILMFAPTDWIMSLEPHWQSTIYAWGIGVGETLAAMLVTVLVLVAAAGRSPIADVFRIKHIHDYGTLIFVFIILLTYMMFFQYLIIWAGNVPEEIEWYVHRSEGGWDWVAPFLAVFHFAVPFLLLLSRRVKRSLPAMRALAGALLLVHVVYVGWLVLPAFNAPGFKTLTAFSYVMAVVALLGVGGLWTACYAWNIRQHRILPVGDPRFEEEFEGASFLLKET